MSDGINKLAQTLISLKDANSPQCDRTLFCPIVKNNKGISTILTAEQASKLSACDEYWYYVKIQDQCFKLECKNSNFAIDEEVRVCIPCGNYERMYIDFKAGTIEDEDAYEEWVRPTEWGIPPNVADNQIFILFRDTGGLEVQLIGLDYSLAEPAVAKWGDGTSSTFINYDIVQHTYTTDGYHQCMITINGGGIDEVVCQFRHLSTTTTKWGVVEIIIGRGIGTNSPYPTYSSNFYCTANLEHLKIPNCCGINIYEENNSSMITNNRQYSVMKKFEVTPSAYIGAFKFYNGSLGFGGDIFELDECVTHLSNDGTYVLNYNGIERVIVAKGLEELPPNAFSNNYQLEEVVMPNLKIMRESCFYGAYNLKSFTFDNVEIMEVNALNWFHSIQRIVAPKLVSISRSSVGYDSDLEYFEAPLLPLLPWDAFAYQCHLTEIVVPSCEKIETQAIRYCPNLKKITVKTGCVVEDDSVPPWTEIIYVD